MKTIIIRDARQRPVATIVEGNSSNLLYNSTKTKLIAMFNKSTNATYTATGRLIGHGNLLMTQIRM